MAVAIPLVDIRYWPLKPSFLTNSYEEPIY